MSPLWNPNRMWSPYEFKQVFWPKVNFYDKQWEIIESSERDDETVTVAANEMGKDFVFAFIALYKFCTRRPCRGVLSSAKDKHLIVLLSEMKNFIQTAKYPMTADRGGPLVVNHQEIFWELNGVRCEKSYIMGMVASDESIASLGGHHIANVGDGIKRTFWMGDEASSLKDAYYKMVTPWANWVGIIGNAYDCNNFFRRAVKGDRKHNIPGGDIIRDYSEDDLRRFLESRPGKTYSFPNNKPAPRGYHRRVIKIKATDSPNVKFALAQQAKGIVPDDTMVIPGVKSWSKYQANLKMWDPIEQSVKLDAEFYEGTTLRMFPKDWLDRAEEMAELLRLKGVKRGPFALGVDPAEGGDKTAVCVGDQLGIVDMEYGQTPNTADIKHMILRFMKKYSIDPSRVMIDRGGGGKQIADQLREMDQEVRTVSFGEAILSPIQRGIVQPEERLEVREERYTYKNRRAQMYGRLMERLDPEDPENPNTKKMTYAIPHRFPSGGFAADLRDELEPIPKKYKEGMLYMLPKHKTGKNEAEETLTELIGHSPDLADSAVLMLYGVEQPEEFVVGGW